MNFNISLFLSLLAATSLTAQASNTFQKIGVGIAIGTATSATTQVVIRAIDAVWESPESQQTRLSLQEKRLELQKARVELEIAREENRNRRFSEYKMLRTEDISEETDPVIKAQKEQEVREASEKFIRSKLEVALRIEEIKKQPEEESRLLWKVAAVGITAGATAGAATYAVIKYTAGAA